MGVVLEGQDLLRGGGAPVPLAAAAPASPQDRQFARASTSSGPRAAAGGGELAGGAPTGHFSSAHRNDVLLLRSGGRGQPQRWAIVAAATTSMGHRCGCQARLSSIDVPTLRLRPSGWRPGAWCAGSCGPERRTRGTGSGRAREPVAWNGAVAPDAVTFTLYEPEPHWRAIDVSGAPALTTSPGRAIDVVARPARPRLTQLRPARSHPPTHR